MAQDAYVTMLFSDSYLQGAQVLAASLRDGGTSKKLAVIVPSDDANRLLPQTISQLEESFDFVIPMPTFRSTNFANLRLLERPDLALTLTKINLWRLVQFRKCVYLDADVLALRAPDELFSLDTDFAGVFLFKPNMATYYALKALADSGITFDGGDQGLLNTFFPAYHRLSFTYNVTPSTNYQYTPAYRHFSSNISLFHFIGRTKPWEQRSYGQDSFNEATGRWWSVYEKHYGWKIREDELRREQEAALTRRGRDFTPPRQTESFPQSQPISHEQHHYHHHHHEYHPRFEPSDRPRTPDKGKKQVSFGTTDTTFFHPAAPAPELSTFPPSYHPPAPAPAPAPAAPPPPRQPSPPPFEPKMVTWDPARSAPPPDSGPEAQNLAISSYASAWDKPYNPNEPKWVPPPPSPLPRGYEYTPPAPPPPPPAAPESHDPSSDEESEAEAPEPGSGYHTSDSESPEGAVEKRQERFSPVFPWEMRGQRQVATRVFPGDIPSKGKEPLSEPLPPDRRPSLEKYEFSNAWDSLPIIQSYVKQKLGETPAPPSTSAKPKVESPSTPTVPISVLATATVVSATEGERWDPNKQLDKLRGTVISKLRQQQEAKKQSTTESTKEAGGGHDDANATPAQPISADDGN